MTRLTIATIITLVCARAHANGAFPDSDQVLTPTVAPHRVLLGTNFGLVISEDDGMTWHLACEQAMVPASTMQPCVRLYSDNASADTLFAVTTQGLAVLTQGACANQLAQGPFLDVGVSDAFADPSDPTHVFAIALASSSAGGQVTGLYESKDTGAHFGDPLLQAPSGVFLSGVEVSRSDPMTVYLTTYGTATPPAPPTLHRSSDRGASFMSFDLSATLGMQRIRLASVDPANPQRVFLRTSNKDASGLNVDSLAITEDGGMTVRVPLTLPSNYYMTAFLLRADGTMLVTGLQPNPNGMSGACGAVDFTGSVGSVAYQSTDGGHTFTPWATAPHVRALAERNGTLYVAANNFADGYAVATSTDGGATFSPILHYNQIGGVLSCPSVQAACAQFWTSLASTFGIGDAGVVPPMSPHGCACSLSSRAAWGSSFVPIALLFAAMAMVRRRLRAR
jgi:hypothetical protein